MRNLSLVLMIASALALVAGGANAAEISGTYKGSTRGSPLLVKIEKSGTGYAGVITIAGTDYPFQARMSGDALKGDFTAGADAFPFSMTFSNDRVILSTGKSTYALTRDAAVAADRGAAPVARQAGDGPLVFTKYTLVEPAERIKVAHWLMPKGWKVEGGVLWRHDRALYATYNVRIYNPGTLEHLRGIPTEFRSTPTMPGQQGLDLEGTEYAPLMENPADYITKIAIPEHCRDVPRYKVVGFEELPKLAKKAGEMAKPFEAPGVSVSSAAGRLRIEYELQGQAVEEDFYCSLVYIDCRAKWQQLGLPNGPIQYVPTDLYSIRAAKGRLDAITPMMNATISTMHEDIQMYALRQQIDQIRAKGAAERADVRRRGYEKVRQTQLEINDIITKGYEERQATQDRLQRQYVDTIRGVDRYVEPTSSDTQVQLPSGYEKAWSNGLGEYILSNDAFFDPNQNSSQTWESMKRAKD